MMPRQIRFTVLVLLVGLFAVVLARRLAESELGELRRLLGLVKARRVER